MKYVLLYEAAADFRGHWAEWATFDGRPGNASL
jgi:hypothetical protein